MPPLPRVHRPKASPAKAKLAVPPSPAFEPEPEPLPADDGPPLDPPYPSLDAGSVDPAVAFHVDPTPPPPAMATPPPLPPLPKPAPIPVEHKAGPQLLPIAERSDEFPVPPRLLSSLPPPPGGGPSALAPEPLPAGREKKKKRSEPPAPLGPVLLPTVPTVAVDEEPEAKGFHLGSAAIGFLLGAAVVGVIAFFYLPSPQPVTAGRIPADAELAAHETVPPTSSAAEVPVAEVPEQPPNEQPPNEQPPSEQPPNEQPPSEVPSAQLRIAQRRDARAAARARAREASNPSRTERPASERRTTPRTTTPRTTTPRTTTPRTSDRPVIDDRRTGRPSRTGGRPETPTRQDVAAAISQIRPQLRACAPNLSGHVANVRFTFVASGRATSALVPASFGTPQQRSCVARVARSARVPAFTQSRLSVTYPVQF